MMTVMSYPAHADELGKAGRSHATHDKTLEWLTAKRQDRDLEVPSKSALCRSRAERARGRLCLHAGTPAKGACRLTPMPSMAAIRMRKNLRLQYA